MKRKLKIILSCAITACLTLGLVAYTGHLLDPMSAERALNAIDAFHSLDEDSLEVIIYGSSHAWKGCDPMEMYKQYGIGAYNYGCNWQLLNTTLLFLQDSLRTQSPKVVCIETYKADSIEEDTDMDGQIYYTRSIPNFEGKRKFLRQCFGNNLERYASYYFPLVMFHDNWNQITEENYFTTTKESWIQRMGYHSLTTVKSVTIDDYKTFPQSPLPDSSLEVLDEMMELCEENGIQVLFYTCPYQGEYAYYDAMAEYAEEHQSAYLNLFEYMDEMGLDTETDFRDSTHLNDSGSAKVADFLGEYIVNHYDVTDMRTIDNNLWEQNLTK